MNTKIIKQCGCGRSFTEMQWNALPFIGIQDFLEYDGPVLELRNCECGSTIAITLVEVAPAIDGRKEG